MNIDELKKQYNSNLVLINRGCVYMDSPDVSEVDKDKITPKFLKLIDNANKLVTALESHGVVMDDSTILNGFNEVKEHE